MKVTGVGISFGSEVVDGRLDALERTLALATEIGYDYVEISGYGLSAVINGRLHQAQARRVSAITSRFPLGYTVHGPCELNLCLGETGGVEEQALGAYLEFCAEVGAEAFVYHSGLVNLHEPYWGLTGLPSAETMVERRERECAALERLAPRAQALGVTIGMENRDPHLWEVAALARHGLGVEALTRYHAGLLIPEVNAQIARVAHPNLRMTLDFGHTHIAAKTCGFDFLDAVSQAAPYVQHIHMHDNVGKLDGYTDSQAERLALGQGDLHMLPGWGEIPLEAAFRRLPDFDGVVILELRPRYHEHLAEALASTREILERANKL